MSSSVASFVLELNGVELVVQAMKSAPMRVTLQRTRTLLPALLASREKYKDTVKKSGAGLFYYNR